MDVVDARVRKCKDITVIMDKKMRQRQIVHDKYLIHLDRNNPFEVDEFVKITRKNDFEKLKAILKTLKNERNQLKAQINELQVKLRLQEEYIEKLETGTDNVSGSKKGLFKSLIN
ncbi:MAG: DUF241 domain-containing protein [Methanobacterium sp.]|uniref:hypothetical protein n=1 Tax=Methanobacterium sp. TaxID=2164 RepID=UPI003D64C7F5|nr:DUF241 domain-containing protein [Methanobacterium sp.]